MAEFIYYNANKCWTSATTEVNATGNLGTDTKAGSPGTSFTATDFNVALIRGKKKKEKEEKSQKTITTGELIRLCVHRVNNELCMISLPW